MQSAGLAPANSAAAVIRGLALAIGELTGHTCSATQWPDYGGKGPQGEIDAIIEGTGIKIAVEHTSIDTYENQRQDTKWFQCFHVLETEFQGRVDSYVRLGIPCNALQRGMDWQQIVGEVRRFLPNALLQLGDRFDYYPLNGVPFQIALQIDSTRKPSFRVMRIVPKDYALNMDIAEQLQRKAKKLVKYKQDGYFTILLLESEDIQLMNSGIMVQAIKRALVHERLGTVDEIWFAEVDGPRALYCSIWPKPSPGAVIELTK